LNRCSLSKEPRAQRESNIDGLFWEWTYENHNTWSLPRLLSETEKKMVDDTLKQVSKPACHRNQQCGQTSFWRRQAISRSFCRHPPPTDPFFCEKTTHLDWDLRLFR
jgi:hypothetical protein